MKEKFIGMIIEDGILINGRDCKGDIVIPKNITRIKYDSFKDNKNIRSIKILGNIEKIESSTFARCINLKEVELPNGLKYINYNAFNGCRKLKHINIPDTVINIFGNAFAGTDIESITIPESVTIISYDVFKNCKNLKNVKIEDLNNIKYLENNIFNGCNELLNINVPLICPEKGSFIGYKKCVDSKDDYCIVELKISASALRSSALTNKCRCNKAKVLSITKLNSKTKLQTAFSLYDNDFEYSIGETVMVNDFDQFRWNECAPGIHFFMTKEEAINY